MRAIGEAVTRVQIRRTRCDRRDYMMSERVRARRLQGRQGSRSGHWDQQLRQPILLATPRMLVSVSPQPGFLHQFSRTRHAGHRRAGDPMPASSDQRVTDGHGHESHPDRAARDPASLPPPRRRARRSTSPTRRTTRSPSSTAARCRSISDRAGRQAAARHHALAATASSSTSAPATTTASRSWTSRRSKIVAPPAERARTRAVRPPPRRRAALCRQRGRQHGDGGRHRGGRRIVGEIPVGVEPEGMGISPDGKWLVNTSETTNMAHFIDTDTPRDHRQRAGRQPAALSPSGPKDDARGLGLRRDRRHGQRDRRREARDRPQDHLRGAGRAAGGDPARRRARSPRTASWPSSRSGPANRVAVVDAQTYEVESYLLVGQRVWQLALQPRREAALHHQRRQQRHLGDRRRGAAGR